MACQEKEIVTDVNINPDVKRAQPEKAGDENLPIVDVKATTHLFPKEKIVSATIAPKTGMQTFSSQILLLSDTGKVYGTTTAFPQLELISEGPFSDISGFYLDNGQSGFLAKTESGLTAFLDGGADGFENIKFEAFAYDVTFCEATLNSPGQTVLNSEKGKTIYFLVQDTENGTLMMEDNVGTGKDQHCGQGLEFILPAFTTAPASMDAKSAEQIKEQITSGERVSTEITSHGLVVALEDDRIGINVIDGLSIDGITSPQWVFTTSQPLGNTFNSGVTLIRGDDSNRIVMIANDYLGKTVFGEKINPAQ